nr:IS21 family transposase [uncultured Desulfobulbus sp.]
MISKRAILEIAELKEQGFSIRSIARQLQLNRETVARYLAGGTPKGITIKKPSKLDPYRKMIAEMVASSPDIKAPVVLQRISSKGFNGEITIVRDLLRQLRGQQSLREPFIRFESAPGEQIQIDWGHFDSLSYGQSSRKLYGLAVLEGYSRMLYVYFSHSQQQQALHQGLLEACNYFGGVPKEIVVDNMLTAVTERVGSIIRFNEAFLELLNTFGIRPHACTIRAPHEKGKVENAIKYIRTNFWPARKIVSLDQAQEEVRHWLDTVANVRTHATTGQRPIDRLHGLRPLPDPLPDCRQICTLQVHKDFGVRFDTNVYSVPPWAVGKQVVLKADNQRVSIYLKDKLIACHYRCWQRRQRLELPGHREQVQKIKKSMLRDRQVMVFLSLGETAMQYLDQLSELRLPLKKNITALLSLGDEYGEAALRYGLKTSIAEKAIGADYVRNILYQEMTPVSNHPPVRLDQEDLNEIRLTTPSLAEYDAVALKRRSGNG